MSGISRVEAQLEDLLLSSKHLFDSHQSLSAQVTALVQGTNSQRPGIPASVSASSLSPQVFMSSVHQRNTAMDFQTSRSALDTQIEKQRERDQQKIIQDQLQRCMDAVRGLAGSLSSAMDAWTYHTGNSNHDIHTSLKRVLQEIEQLPLHLHSCHSHGERRSLGTTDTCVCLPGALESCANIFGPCRSTSCEARSGAQPSSTTARDHSNRSNSNSDFPSLPQPNRDYEGMFHSRVWAYIYLLLTLIQGVGGWLISDGSFSATNYNHDIITSSDKSATYMSFERKQGESQEHSTDPSDSSPIDQTAATQIHVDNLSNEQQGNTPPVLSDPASPSEIL